jgi:hypothetical protein
MISRSSMASNVAMTRGTVVDGMSMMNAVGSIRVMDSSM